jgi:hypothetical protein
MGTAGLKNEVCLEGGSFDYTEVRSPSKLKNGVWSEGGSPEPPNNDMKP